MPDSWDSEQYKERAKAWRDRAASLPEGCPEQDACVMLAEGYESSRHSSRPDDPDAWGVELATGIGSRSWTHFHGGGIWPVRRCS
jgi:hypothetical protein